MDRRYVLVLIGFIILFNSCAPTMADIPIDAQADITGRTIFADYETTFEAVTEVFAERGYVIKKSSKNRGIIDCEYLSKSTCFTPWLQHLVGDTRTRAHAYIREIGENTTKVNLRLIVEDKFWTLWDRWMRNDSWLTPEDYKKYFRLIETKVIEEGAPRVQTEPLEQIAPATDPVRLWKLTPLEEEELEEEEEEEEEMVDEQ